MGTASFFPAYRIYEKNKRGHSLQQTCVKVGVQILFNGLVASELTVAVYG
ncbi:hypothetical protein J2R96_008178 [Bradyrhizobium elkanii]|nr:hypothetical protein [Bradyrhizobium elkanii]